MKLKKDFVLRQVAQTWIVLPLAEETVNLSGILTLNDSGAMLWQQLEQGADEAALVRALTDEYEVTAEQAAADVSEFVEKLTRAGCIVQ
jgi:hypothetical protein